MQDQYDDARTRVMLLEGELRELQEANTQQQMYDLRRCSALSACRNRLTRCARTKHACLLAVCYSLCLLACLPCVTRATLNRGQRRSHRTGQYTPRNNKRENQQSPCDTY
jgi:hypothetical protein